MFYLPLRAARKVGDRDDDLEYFSILPTSPP
jgi:hypothetical protein